VLRYPMIRKLNGHTPKIGSGTFLAEGAHVIGDVEIGKNCSIWYNTVLRGDVGPIRVGDETNIQDGTVVHGTFKKHFAVIGSRVTIGHLCMLHGCTIGDECLIGMGAILMDNVKIGPRNIVGAGSLVTEHSDFSDEGWLILGRPAKQVRRLKPEETAFLSKSADNYLMYKTWYETDEGAQVATTPSETERPK
jgi:carbonic anhydrase/acetyltransferase-like protein (isoleucine patch superfamily)